MKFYLSFGYVDEKEVSTRLFHLEEPVSIDVATKLFGFMKSYIGL